MLLHFLLLTGCPDSQVALVATEGGSQARARIDGVKSDTDLAVIRSSINLYRQVNEGRNPPDIASLGINGLYYPDKYVYDPTTGTVTCPECGR